MTEAADMGRTPAARSKLIAFVLLTAGIALLIALAVSATSRSLFTDELMAMANYPLPNFSAAFQPLPYYSQASPPLFSMVIHLLAYVDPIIGRVILLGIVVSAALASTGFVYRSVTAILATLLGLITFSDFIPIASEFKYYALEIPGIVIVTGWLLCKSPTSSITMRDIALLCCAVVLGISSLVFVPVAIATFIILRTGHLLSLTRKEIFPLVVFLALVLLYYLGIRHITSIQINTYFDVYQDGGLARLEFLVRYLASNFGYFALPLVAVSAAVILLDWRDSRSFRLIAYSALTLAAFTVLALVGLYPVSSARHVTWSIGLAIFLMANAACILFERGNSAGLRSRYRISIAVLIGAVIAIALMQPLHSLSIQRPFSLTDNEQAIAELLKRKEQDVGLWIGGQPAINYYRQTYPGLNRFRYFGEIDVASTLLPKDINAKTAKSAPYAETSAALERDRKAPGAWGRTIFYRVRNDYSAPAASLLSEAPKATPFLIFSTHTDLNDPSPATIARIDDLRKALDARACTNRIVAQGKGYFILSVTCP